MRVEFECILCGETATATVPAAATGDREEPMRTLRDCPNCDIETIWVGG